jgi:hypothetical protein
MTFCFGSQHFPQAQVYISLFAFSYSSNPIDVSSVVISPALKSTLIHSLRTICLAFTVPFAFIIRTTYLISVEYSSYLLVLGCIPSTFCCEILGSHSGDYEYHHLLGYDVMYYGKILPTFGSLAVLFTL